jgi:hypothetical protein
MSSLAAAAMFNSFCGYLDYWESLREVHDNNLEKENESFAGLTSCCSPIAHPDILL